MSMLRLPPRTGSPRTRSARRHSRAALASFGPAGCVALGVVVLLVLAVVAPGLIAPGDPNAIDALAALRPPSWTHPLGTDESGRDVWTRVVHGARSSLGVGLAATAIGVAVALVLGFAAGLGPRWLSTVVARVIEILYAFPTLVLALLLVAVRGPGLAASVLAVGIATAPGYSRILRARVRGVADSGDVTAARLEGVGWWRRFGRHIAPNTLWPLVVVVTLGIGQAVVWVAGLGFLGLGALPPAAEWGAMLNAGRVYLTTAWWLSVGPGLAITVTAVALTVLGRALGRVSPA